MKLKARWVDVRVDSLSVDEVLLWRGGRPAARASAVSFRASSRVLDFEDVGEGGPGWRVGPPVL